MVFYKINKFLFSFSLFFYLSLTATIILDFSLRLTHTFCYSSPLPTDFLSFSLYHPFFSFSLRLYSFLNIPVPSFRRNTHFHSSSPSTCRPSSSFLFVDVPPLHFYSDFASSSSSLFFSRHLVWLMCHPSFSFIFFSHFMLLFFCFILAYFSFYTSCLMFSLAHVFDLVAFAFSFHPPRLSSSISVSSPLSLSLLSVLLALKVHFPLFLLH